ESNIQVVVRVRGMAPGEAPPIQPILSTSGPHCSSINVAMEVQQSASAVNVAANSVQSSLVGDGGNVRERSYPFDHVFGPEADQGMVYQSVVGPVLNEVMNGYNCTVFAYGQTGTGKTHTMEGDLTSQLGTYSAEAGIIPRTLYRLFHTLELSKDEYSVHATFVELYNEELRDLLSDEAPQPLGGGKDSAGLRMYEDKGKGVNIQGLEDIPMRDAEHGLKLLRKGSQKRHIAATRCNESSSRSHCVFTLTVHIKETTSKGEDVLRTGKLNLVDLAGSENIGRSGAENKRAREAGMINQSLLTLGRVINALVEKSSHIPYRESKLTRLLQESLGGRTKTCIIATVSSERSNMEETLSTLDYALRAKSIRNRPEVNQRMTRAALIKEYVHEIERLKGDLLASREKSGIFLSPESWQLMQEEHDGARSQVEELRRHGEVVESKMVSLKEQFEQSMQLLLKREAESKTIRSEFEQKEEELQQILGQIDELKRAEQEERELREAYMRSEKRLDGVARGLRGMFYESAGDVDGLFSKLDRKAKVERRNRDLLAECQASLASISNQLEARVTDFGSSHEQFTMDLSAQLREFQVREQDKLKANRESIDQKLQALLSLTRSISADHQQNKGAIDELADAIRREGDRFVGACQERSEMLHSTCQSLVQDVSQSHRESLIGVRAGIEEMGEMSMNIIKLAKERANQDKKGLEDVRTLSSDTIHRELARLQTQNDQLAKLLVEEREKSTNMRDGLCKNINQMVMNFCQQREQTFSTAIEAVRQGNAGAQDDVQTFSRQHTDKVDEMLERNQSVRETLKEKERLAKAQRIRSEAGLNQSSAAIEQKMHGFTGNFFTVQQEDLEQARSTMQAISGNVDGIREVAESSRQSESRNVQLMRNDIEEGFTEASMEIQSTLEDVEETCEVAIEGVEEQRMLGNAFLDDTNAQLSMLRSNAQTYLTSKLLTDMPTGTTPQKRDWPAVASWSLV
ncbi:kinesin-domain-containing protein, partial [Meira miltonrushii]